jgi:hypothetical protein
VKDGGTKVVRLWIRASMPGFRGEAGSLRSASLGGKCNRFDRAFWEEVDEQKSILENSWIDGAPAGFAAPPVGKYKFSPVPSFRCHLAIEVGVEATR